jgi:HAD superfamily hydrolase (TIGR01509 family)
VTLVPHPEPDTAALLFDCDGTLVDTMGVHRIVWAEIFARYGFEITDQWWEDYANVALMPFVRAVIPDASEELADELNIEGMARYMEAIHLAEPLEHVIEVVRAHHGRLPMAVVTGGYREIVVPTLDAAGITHLFDVIVTADDVVHSKPAPDVYERAAALLQVDPARCVAYEDSEIGMASAHGAGIGRIVDIRLFLDV